MNIQKVGLFIAELRKKKQLTQLELGNLIGTSGKTISKWENGYGFPELTYQKTLCDVLEIELEELHNGELNVKKRRKSKMRKVMNCVFLIFVCIAIPLLIFWGCFFADNYETLKFYQIDTKDSSVKATAKGMLVETNSNTTIYVGNISLWNYTLLNTDIINVEIYSNKELLYRANELDNIWITLDEKIKLDKENLMIKVTINTKGDRELIYGIQLKLVQMKESENKLITSNINKQSLSDEQIEENFINAGFKKENDKYVLENKNKTSQTKVMYFPENRTINYIDYRMDILQNFIFYENSYHLDVYIYHKDGSQDILFEKYTYHYKDKKLDCQVGVCSSLENVLKTMGKYITLLIGDMNSTM